MHVEDMSGAYVQIYIVKNVPFLLSVFVFLGCFMSLNFVKKNNPRTCNLYRSKQVNLTEKGVFFFIIY